MASSVPCVPTPHSDKLAWWSQTRWYGGLLVGPVHLSFGHQITAIMTGKRSNQKPRSLVGPLYERAARAEDDGCCGASCAEDVRSGAGDSPHGFIDVPY